MLSHKLVLNESMNFTSGHPILAPPTIPINHYFRNRNQQNSSKVVSCYSMLEYSIAKRCLEHSNFLTVKGTILNGRVNKDQPLNSNEIGCVSTENRSKLGNNTTRRNPTTSFLTATTLIYAIGAGITAAAGTRLALQWVLDKKFNLFSFQLPDPKRSGIVIFCHYLPESGLGNLRACCLP